MHITRARALLLILVVACAKNPVPDTQIPKSVPAAQSNPPAESTTSSSNIVGSQNQAVPQPEIERLFLTTVEQQLSGITIEPAATADIQNMLHLASIRLANAHADEKTVRQAIESVQRFAEAARTKAKHEVFTVTDTTDTTATMATDTTGSTATTTGPTATDTTGTRSVEEDVIDLAVVRSTRLSLCPLYPIC